MSKKRAYIQFRLSDDVFEQLEALADEAKARGAKNASPNIVARSLLQAALGLPPTVAAANESMLLAFAAQKRLSTALSVLVTENLPELLAEATVSG